MEETSIVDIKQVIEYWKKGYKFKKRKPLITEYYIDYAKGKVIFVFWFKEPEPRRKTSSRRIKR